MIISACTFKIIIKELFHFTESISLTDALLAAPLLLVKKEESKVTAFGKAPEILAVKGKGSFISYSITCAQSICRV